MHKNDFSIPFFFTTLWLFQVSQFNAHSKNKKRNYNTNEAGLEMQQSFVKAWIVTWNDPWARQSSQGTIYPVTWSYITYTSIFTCVMVLVLFIGVHVVRTLHGVHVFLLAGIIHFCLLSYTIPWWHNPSLWSNRWSS